MPLPLLAIPAAGGAIVLKLLLGATVLSGLLTAFAHIVESGNEQQIDDFFALKARQYPKVVDRIEQNLRAGIYPEDKADYIAIKLKEFRKKHG